ncbi:MAG: efflux RND transporter permease subunit [Bacteroidota bacterium]
MKLVALSTRRRVTIAMFTVAVLLFGSVSLSRLDINLLPDLSHPALTIRTEYVGAAPIELENLITKPVEEALGVVEGVESLRSVSRTGQSDVILEFAWGTDMDYASLEVREKLDALQLPLEATRPIILRFDPALDPVLRYGLTRKTPEPAQIADGSVPVRSAQLATETGLDEEALKQLRRFADEEVKKELESATGVAAVKISGGLEDEVQVLVDQEQMSQHGLSMSQLVQVLGAENINQSGGRLEEGTQQYLVRTLNEFGTVAEIGNVIVSAQMGQAPIYVRDVALVQLGYKEREAISRIDGKEAVEIAIYKEGDANTVAVAEAVDRKLKRVQELLPADMELVGVYDQSTFISSAVNEVVNAAWIGGLLAILILYLFLRDFKTTAIISLSIPVSVVATFNLMYGFDLSLNIMSLGGLALGIGLLVDNSIVVLENIARHREEGKSALEAARDGASEVGMAVVASTLTTVAVFVPLVFVEGIAGQLFRDQALTVTFALLASLLVALTLIPMLASIGRQTSRSTPAPEAAEERIPRTAIGRKARAVRQAVFWTAPAALTRWAAAGARGVGRGMRLLFTPLTWGLNALYDAVARVYRPVLRWSLGHRAVVLLVAFTLFGTSLLLVPSLGIELIPSLTQDEYNVELKLAPGTPLEQTDQALARVQRAAASAPQVRATFAVSGTGNRMDANPDEGGENWGEIHVALDGGSGEAGEAASMDALRASLAQVPGAQYKFSRPTLFTFDTPIEVEVSGYNLDDLQRVAQALANRLSESDRFADVKSSMEGGHPEVQIIFDRERAAMLGLAVHELADRVVQHVRGEVATRYSWHDRKIDVLVRSQEQDRTSVRDLETLLINTESERPLPLSAVADVVVDTGPGEIRRVGQQRVALVTANLRYGDLGAAAEAIDEAMASVVVPEGLSIRQAGQNEEMGRSFRSLLFALALAVFLVYLVMASQFESLLHPFVIFFSIPLAAIGAVWALWATGSTLSVVVFIGLILLAGIVVNNAIVLVDLINQLRAQGRAKIEAIIEAGHLRLRPILMTTLTTTLGLLPMAIGFGDGAEIRAPMAITVIGGLVVSTALTLVVIPTMYAVLDRGT